MVRVQGCKAWLGVFDAQRLTGVTFITESRTWNWESGSYTRLVSAHSAFAFDVAMPPSSRYETVPMALVDTNYRFISVVDTGAEDEVLDTALLESEDDGEDPEFEKINAQRLQLLATRLNSRLTYQWQEARLALVRERIRTMLMPYYEREYASIEEIAQEVRLSRVKCR